MSRFRATTEPVKTPFGNIYCHVHEDMAGRPIEVRFSSPGKFADTTVDAAFRAAGDTITQILKSHARENRAIARAGIDLETDGVGI